MSSSPDVDERIRRLLREHVEIVPYDPRWPELFARERDHLRAALPGDLVGRIEHFGSTAVAGLAAKPIVDLLVEVRDLEETKSRVAPLLESQGYDYIWRPTSGDDVGPWYAWFIKRDPAGARTHHIHMVEAHFPQWEALLFRDHLRAHRDVAAEYESLKRRLAAEFPNDREAYSVGKKAFIETITTRALERPADQSLIVNP
jgi:GrpB-like predicted nucleotidyltransferase (UPF0157 family)